jgi:hypothetical protein
MIVCHARAHEQKGGSGMTGKEQGAMQQVGRFRQPVGNGHKKATAKVA